MSNNINTLFKEAEKNTDTLKKVALLEIEGSGPNKPKEIFEMLDREKEDKEGDFSFLKYKFVSLGLGVEKNIETAKKLLEYSAQKGNANANYEYAMAIRYGLSGYKENLQLAEESFRVASNKDLVNAQYELALMYLDGVEVKKDLKEAFRWLAKAAAGKHVNAAYIMGKFYYDGIKDGYFVLSQDVEKAIKYWSLSSKLGHKGASYELAVAHIKLAYELLSLNTDNKSKNLIENLNNIVEM